MTDSRQTDRQTVLSRHSKQNKKLGAGYGNTKVELPFNFELL